MPKTTTWFALLATTITATAVAGCRAEVEDTEQSAEMLSSGAICESNAWGMYCGNDKMRDADPSTLYYCRGAGRAPQSERKCASGCQVKPDGTADLCNAASNPTTDAKPPVGTDGGAGFQIPLACNTTVEILQGPGGPYSHSGTQSKDAYDFGISNDTTLLATEEGVVSLVNGSVGPKDACYRNGGYDCRSTVNYVVVAHADGTDTLYLHVNAPLVPVGRKVNRGDPIALSGGTGWSPDGPHAHVQRQARCGIWICNSIPLPFTYSQQTGEPPKQVVEVVKGGVPLGGAVVTSMNCP